MIVAGGLKFFPPSYATIRLLRGELRSTLPIELWCTAGEEPSPLLRAELEDSLGVRVRSLEDVYPGGSASVFRSYNAKLFAIMFSSFRDVVFIDSDCHPVVDPAPLFHDPAFVDTGAVFWPDYWPGSVWPELLRALAVLPPSAKDDEPLPRGDPFEGSHESGQMLVDKSRTWKALQLAAFLTLQADRVYHRTLRDGDVGFGVGDKELLPLAMRALGMPQHRVQTPIAAVGDSCGGDNSRPGEYSTVAQCSRPELAEGFNAHTMAQHVPTAPPDGPPAVAFLHRNCQKLRVSLLPDVANLTSDLRAFRLARRVHPEGLRAENRSWYTREEMGSPMLHGAPLRAGWPPECRSSPHGPRVETVEFGALVGWDVEQALHTALRELKRSDAWAQYVHVRQRRFGDDAPV